MVQNISVKESDGMVTHAFEYSAMWGSTVGDGPLFYNVSTQADQWKKSDWKKFMEAINKVISLVRANPSNFDKDESQTLENLKDWALLNFYRAKKG